MSAESLKLDAEKSKITFVGKKADGQHDGGFKKFTVKAVADFENADKSSISIDIDATALWADNPKLEGHLKNADFFDVRNHATIKFESTKIVPMGDGKGEIVGKLTLLGKTNELKVPVKIEHGDKQLRLTADFMLDRTKWGMIYGAGKVNNDVQVKADLTLLR